jgi:N-acetylmuramoyl-L-alanine amidase
MIHRTHLIIHHSLTADSGTVSWSAIERYHVQTNHWSDIGYHYGVELAGTDYVALVGRSEVEVAAACKEAHMNQLGIHICCVGNYDLLPPRLLMLDVLVHRLVKPLMVRYGIPKANIVGHRDFAPYKTCPGKWFDLESIRELI